MELSSPTDLQERPFLAIMLRLPEVEHSHPEECLSPAKDRHQLRCTVRPHFFSPLNLVSRYCQVPLNQEAIGRSGFVTRGGL